MEGIKKDATWPKTVDTPTRGKNLPIIDVMGGEEKPNVAEDVEAETAHEGKEVTEESGVEGERESKTDLYKEAREEYNSYSKKVREAQKRFIEAMDEYRFEYQNSGFMKHFMSTEKLDEKEFNMLKAQDEYDKLLDGLRKLREKRVILFAEKLSKKAKREENSVSKLENATSYIARHEAILERQIDHEVELLESLRSKKGDKEDGKNEAKNRLLHGMKVGWNWYRNLSPKQRLVYSTALATGIGAVMGATGVIAGGVFLGGATKAGRRMIGGTLGAAVAGVTKRSGDALVNKYEEHKKRELKDTFSKESLGRSRRERLALNKKVKIGKHVATGAAAASAFAVGMEVSKIGAEVVDAVTGVGGAHDAVESAVSAKHDVMEHTTKSVVVEKAMENNKEFAKKLATTDAGHGSVGVASESGASAIEKGNFHIGDTKFHEELAKRLGIDPSGIHVVKENGVLTINGRPVSDELLGEYLADEQIKHFKLSGHYNKMMNAGEDGITQTNSTYVASDTNHFTNTRSGVGAVIESDKENIDPSVYESDATGTVDKTSSDVGVNAGGEVVRETLEKEINGDVYASPYEEYLDKGYDHGPQVDDLLEKFGIEKVELGSSVPHDLGIDPISHEELKPKLKFEGVYEHGSSIERELQGFLKDNDWIKEKYPNLTDVERGKIAHRLGLKILSDNGLLDKLKVRGGNPNLVWEGDKYSMDIGKDVIEKEIEAVHGGGHVEVEVLHDSAKEPAPSTHPYEDNDAYERRIPTTVDADDDAVNIENVEHDKMPIAEDGGDAHQVGHTHAGSVVENATHAEHRTLESDLESATEKLMEQKADYQGLATRPIVESLFKDKIFDGVIAGQRPMILSNWGPISHVHLQDVFDGEGKLTYTIGGETIEMGADAENLTVGIMNQLERNLSDKLPNIDEIISQGRENNITIGDLMKKILSEIEKKSPNSISDNAEVVEKVSDVQDAGVTEHVDVTGTDAETSLGDADKHVDSIHKEPLDKYYEKAKPELIETDAGKYTVNLIPIDINKDVENYVDKIYISKHPEWTTSNAKALYDSDTVFRESLNSELQDIKIELVNGKDLDFSAVDIDWSKYENMTAKDVLEQLEQHKEMLKKMNADYNAPAGVKKFIRTFTRKQST